MHWLLLHSDNLFSLSWCRVRRELRDVNELRHFTWLEVLPVQMLVAPPLYPLTTHIVFPPDNSWEEDTGVRM